MLEFTPEEWQRRLFESGDRLRRARRYLGLTQRELASQVGLADYRTISRFERGASLPSMPVMLYLSRVLRRQISDLLRPLDLFAAEDLRQRGAFEPNDDLRPPS